MLERQGRKATGLMHINAMIAGLPFRQQLDTADIGWCPFCRSLGTSFENDEEFLIQRIWNFWSTNDNADNQTSRLFLTRWCCHVRRGIGMQYPLSHAIAESKYFMSCLLVCLRINPCNSLWDFAAIERWFALRQSLFCIS